MKNILLTHLLLLIVLTALFFSLGAIDKAMFDKTSISHKPKLIFCYAKDIAADGGSIFWESFIYQAHEGRAMRVWNENGEQKHAMGFQGTWWTWKCHNLMWLWLIVCSSFAGSTITYHKFKPAFLLRANGATPSQPGATPQVTAQKANEG